MNVDIYRSPNDPYSYLAVTTGADVTTLALPEEWKNSRTPARTMEIGKDIPRVGINFAIASAEIRQKKFHLFRSRIQILDEPEQSR